MTQQIHIIIPHCLEKDKSVVKVSIWSLFHFLKITPHIPRENAVQSCKLVCFFLLEIGRFQ
jgi:hypothetical protein